MTSLDNTALVEKISDLTDNAVVHSCTITGGVVNYNKYCKFTDAPYVYAIRPVRSDLIGNSDFSRTMLSDATVAFTSI